MQPIASPKFGFSTTIPSGVTNPRPPGVCIFDTALCTRFDLSKRSGPSVTSQLLFPGCLQGALSGGKILRLLRLCAATGASSFCLEQPAPRPSCICSASASCRSIPAVECFGLLPCRRDGVHCVWARKLVMFKESHFIAEEKGK